MDKRAAIMELFRKKFGKDHNCLADINTILRTEKDVKVRFMQDGKFWELRQAGGALELVLAK